MGEQQVSRLADDMGDIDSNIKLSAVSCPSYVKSKNNSKQFPYFVYPIAGLTKLSAARFDIMTANRKSADKFIRKQNLLKVVVPAAGFLLLLALIYGALSTVAYLQQKQLSDLTKENSNPTILANVNKYEKMADVVTGVGGRQGGLNILHKYLDSYPIPDSKVNTLISDAAFKYSVNVIVNSYDSASGVFSITAQASEVELINQFIADLMKMENFEKVDYTGYTAIKAKDGTSGWQINVVCTLAARNTEAKKAEGDA